jgi:hypothetical protein
MDTRDRNQGVDVCFGEMEWDRKSETKTFAF